MTSPILRPYQDLGVRTARAHILAGRKRVILCGPTGGGKTVVASSIIHSARRNFNAKILFVVHRKELIDQTVRQLAKYGVHEVGVIMADDARTNRLMPVQVATIQSLARRSAPPADIVFVDEAHRAAADSYKKLISLYPDAAIIGLTATPCRADGKPLGDVFEAIEVFATYEELIRDKFIVQPRCFSSRAPINLGGVRTVAGDYNIGEIEEIMMDMHVLGDTLEQYQKRAGGRRTVIFASTVNHSLAIRDQFLQAGIRIAHVDANTPENERADISRKLDTREIDAVTNVGIYTEGWDQPSVKCLIIARPTKSLTLLMQMAGRGLRPWVENGESVDPIIIDQGENIPRHGWPHEDRVWSLDEGAKSKKKRPAKCIQCGAFIDSYPCEECGFAPPAPPPRIVKIDPSVELVERDMSERDKALAALARTQTVERRSYFDMQVEVARARGFKPGFAAAKFKEKFGMWPPWDWSQGAKKMMESDSTWKFRNKVREENRARWTAEESAGQETTYDTDDDFAKWVSS